MLPAALVDAIREGGVDARLVAADWLLERGESAHGELIAAMVRTPGETARIDALIGALLGDAVGDLAIARAGWGAGFLDRIACELRDEQDLARVKRLVQQPIGCAVRAIELAAPRFTVWDTDLIGILAVAPPSLRVFALTSPAPIGMAAAMDARWTTLGWEHLANLVELRLGSQAGFGLRALPALEELVLASCDRGALEALRALEAPRLARLRLGIPQVVAPSFVPGSLGVVGPPAADPVGRRRAAVEAIAQLDASRFPRLHHVAIEGERVAVAELRSAPLARGATTLEVVAGFEGERDRRWFPIDRGARDLRGLLDLGVAPGSVPGRLIRLDENPGRHDVDRARIEYTGVDWWLRAAPPDTRVNGAALEHVRLLPGDRLTIGGVHYRCVGADEDLAALRARTALPEPARVSR